MEISEATTFGKYIAKARRRKGLNLRECASMIQKEDGTPISFQYLNDVEKNRRRPPSEHIIKQISAVLDLPEEALYLYARMFPANVDISASPELIVTAYREFVQKLSHKAA